MNRRFILLVSIALLTGIIVPIMTHMLLNTPVQTTTITKSTTPLSEEKKTEGELSSYGEIVELLSRTLNYKKLTTSLQRSFYSYWRAYPLETMPLVAEVVKATAQEVTTTRVSWTNVQVAGIDEPDIVKTNGKLITVASSREVILVSVQEKKVISRIAVKESSVQGLFLRDNKLVVIARDVNETNVPVILINDVVLFAPCEYAVVYVFDVSDPKEPNQLMRIEIGGSFLSARLLGDVVYIVSNQPAVEDEARLLIPVVDALPVSTRSIVFTGALGEVYANVLSINLTGLEYAVKSILMPAGSRLYMSYGKLYIVSSTQPSIVDAYRHFIVATTKLLPPSVSSHIEAYLEREDLVSAYDYLVEYINGMDKPEEFLEKVKKELESVELTDSTCIHVFEVKGLEVNYIDKVTLEGTVLDQFAIEEYGDYLVVATTVNSYKVSLLHSWRFVVAPQQPGTEQNVTISVCNGTGCYYVTVIVKYANTSSEVIIKSEEKIVYVYPYMHVSDSSDNRVYTISLDQLGVKGVLKGLARGERIYAARLIKSTLFLVTFRQVDPLFAIDLSDPENPEVLGYLKIPGFSEYLHPLPGEALFGIGCEDFSDLKISLFDVKNPANMSEVAKIVISAASSPALQDYHAVTVDLDYNYVYIPVALYGATRSEKPTGIAVVHFENNVLQLKAILSHPGATRALYVGNELYTISPSLIRVFNIESLELITEIRLK